MRSLKLLEIVVEDVIESPEMVVLIRTLKSCVGYSWLYVEVEGGCKIMLIMDEVPSQTVDRK